MTGRFRTLAQRYALSMPIVEMGFFAMMIFAMAMVA